MPIAKTKDQLTDILVKPRLTPGDERVIQEGLAVLKDAMTVKAFKARAKSFSSPKPFSALPDGTVKAWLTNYLRQELFHDQLGPKQSKNVKRVTQGLEQRGFLQPLEYEMESWKDTFGTQSPFMAFVIDQTTDLFAQVLMDEFTDQKVAMQAMRDRFWALEFVFTSKNREPIMIAKPNSVLLQMAMNPSDYVVTPEKLGALSDKEKLMVFEMVLELRLDFSAEKNIKKNAEENLGRIENILRDFAIRKNDPQFNRLVSQAHPRLLFPDLKGRKDIVELIKRYVDCFSSGFLPAEDPALHAVLAEYNNVLGAISVLGSSLGSWEQVIQESITHHTAEQKLGTPTGAILLEALLGIKFIKDKTGINTGGHHTDPQFEKALVLARQNLQGGFVDLFEKIVGQAKKGVWAEDDLVTLNRAMAEHYPDDMARMGPHAAMFRDLHVAKWDDMVGLIDQQSWRGAWSQLNHEHFFPCVIASIRMLSTFFGFEIRFHSDVAPTIPASTDWTVASQSWDFDDPMLQDQSAMPEPMNSATEFAPSPKSEKGPFAVQTPQLELEWEDSVPSQQQPQPEHEDLSLSRFAMLEPYGDGPSPLQLAPKPSQLTLSQSPKRALELKTKDEDTNVDPVSDVLGVNLPASAVQRTGIKLLGKL